MPYAIKEMFLTLQGEGVHAGRPAILLRFTGCNLWSGREEDRATAICNFCDTDFLGTDGPGGGRFETARELALAAISLWPDKDPRAQPFVFCTGGEPLLQLDQPLLDALHAQNFYVAVETNGTIRCPADVDWITVSPKAATTLQQRTGQELKLVYPQPGCDPQELLALDFQHFLLQPMAGPELERNTQLALDFCLSNPRWRLSLQTHKILRIP